VIDQGIGQGARHFLRAIDIDQSDDLAQVQPPG
jgi:hypothetical protein